MLQGWPESQSTAQKIVVPGFDISTVIRDGSVMSSSRQRTSQACDKCRERKTKCSGDRPICKRCTTRGLKCAYSCREQRSRGPTKPRPRASSAIALPTVTLELQATSQPLYTAAQAGTNGGSREQHHLRRQQRYKPAAFPQQQRTPAETKLLADAFVLSESTSRHHMSHDFRQLQSRRLEPSMFPPVVKQETRQIPSLTKRNTATSSASVDYVALDHRFLPVQNNVQPLHNSNTWNGNGIGTMGCIDCSTPPSLSHSTSTSVTHSPSSSEHDQYQSITTFERPMDPYADATFYGHQPDVFDGLEPALIRPCVKVGNGGVGSTGSIGMGSAPCDAGLELQYPTPVTAIDMENLETDITSPALG